MVRRWGLGVVLSVAIHGLVVGGAVGLALLLGIPLGKVDVEIVGMSLDDIKDLPLGPPPGAPPGAPAPVAPRARPLEPKEAIAAGELATTAAPGKKRRSKGDEDDAPATPAAGAPHVTDLRQYGPEGSRVTALVRLDRLRGTPYGPAVDEILSRLPDRHDLLDGTGLDLYKDLDALLIATPNPLDYTVTFLAVRHHLGDAQLKAALERGAKATGRVLTWHTEARRPIAERHPSDLATTGRSRDQRILALVAPGLAVVTPPVYRSMLLRPPRPRTAATPTPAAGSDAGADAGSAGAPVGTAPADGTHFEGDGWRALLRRIDAEDSVLPPNAVAMLNAVDIFGAQTLRQGLRGVPTRGLAGEPGVPATVFGMELPRLINVVLGTKPLPFADIKAELPDQAAAEHWEREWPVLRRKWAVNPYLVLTGFVPLLNRAEMIREGSLIHLHITATEEETLRLLQLIARFGG